LRANSVWQDTLGTEPRLISHPAEAGPSWTRMLWNRRAYEKVMGILRSTAIG